MIEFDPLAEPATVSPLTDVEGSPPGRLAWSQGVIESLLALKASRPLVAISAAAVICLALAMVAAMVALRSRPSVASTPAANAEKPSGSNASPSASVELPPADVESPRVARPPAPPPVQRTNPAVQQATVRDIAPRSGAVTSARNTAPVVEPSPAKSVNTRPAQAAPTVAAAAPTPVAAPTPATAPTITVAAPTVTIAAPTVTGPPTVTAAAPTTSATPGAPEPVVPDRVYTSIDPGVVAPVLVRPYLPELSDPNAPNLRLGVLEVVIGTTGLVESVRLRSPENRYRERWWLFVAKNWQFRPAYKDGQPVRYLKVIPLTDIRLSDPQ